MAAGVTGINVVFSLSGHERTLLVDTGAELSILRKAVSGVPVQQVLTKAKGVTGANLAVLGAQELECQVAHLRVKHTFVIANIETWRDGLVGWDLLQKLGAVVDVAHGGVTFMGVSDPSVKSVVEDQAKPSAIVGLFQGTRPSEDSKRLDEYRKKCKKGMIGTELVGEEAGRRPASVRLISAVTVPAYSEVILGGSVEAEEGMNLVMEPVVLPQNNLRVARCLSQVKNHQVWVKAVNLSPESLVIPKRQILAVAEPMGSAVEEYLEGRGAGLLPRREELAEKLNHLPREEAGVIEEVLWAYRELFTEPGKEGCKSGIEHRIPTGDARPIMKRPYRVPHHLRPVVEEHLADMLDKGVIVPSSSPWSAPVVLVPKKTTDGTLKYRFCTDFRALNEVTKGDAYPLPLIQETLENLGNSRYYTTLDLASGYHQIPIAAEDQEKTGFTTVGGHFEYQRMAFGLTGAPATFQRYMDNLLASLKGTECLVYLDDVIIFSTTINQHAERLIHVLDTFQRANLKVNLEKCKFAQASVNYLGHLVTAEGVKPDPSKIEAIKGFPQPRNVREVRGFLGLAGYYRRFIPNFAEIAKAITALTKKDVKFRWGEEQEKSFNQLKSALCSDSVLVYPDFEKGFILATDASNTALGAVLSQEYEGEERPVAYASRQMNSAERNYSTTERELLAVVWATQQFRCYLLGRPFKLITDHAALRWMLSLRDPSSRLTRWALRLAEFEYHVEHKPGRKHTNADALSRAAVVASVFDCFTWNELSESQSKDAWCQKVLAAKDYRVRKRAGILYWADEENDVSRWRILVPEPLREKIIENCHSVMWAGHPGTERTLSRVKQQYYWPKMNRDVDEFVKRCESCAKRKSPNQLKVPLAAPYEPVAPFEMVSLDIVGPLPASKQGNKYLLTFIDHFSRYAEAVPLADQTAETTARAFVKYILTRHGVPERLLTDQGRNFTSELFTTTCKILGIKKLRTTAYHPESNGR